MEWLNEWTKRHCIHSMNITMAVHLGPICISLSSPLCDVRRNFAGNRRVESKFWLQSHYLWDRHSLSVDFLSFRNKGHGFLQDTGWGPVETMVSKGFVTAQHLNPCERIYYMFPLFKSVQFSAACDTTTTTPQFHLPEGESFRKSQCPRSVRHWCILASFSQYIDIQGVPIVVQQ